MFRKLFLTLIALISFLPSFCQSETEIKQSVDYLNKNILDSNNSSVERIKKMNKMVDLLEKDSLFPYSDFDSLIFVTYKID